MTGESSAQFEKMSSEEIDQVVGAIGEFTSTHPREALKEITGLQIARGGVEEQLSNRKPPKEIAPDAEIIAIDECLGLYNPRRKQIVLFQRGIAAAANILKCEVDEIPRWNSTICFLLGLYSPRHSSIAMISASGAISFGGFRLDSCSSTPPLAIC